MTAKDNIRLVLLEPSAGEPVGQESNSHGWVRGVGVAVDEPVPDLSCVGADSMTYNTNKSD